MVPIKYVLDLFVLSRSELVASSHMNERDQPWSVTFFFFGRDDQRLKWASFIELCAFIKEKRSIGGSREPQHTPPQFVNRYFHMFSVLWWTLISMICSQPMDVFQNQWKGKGRKGEKRIGEMLLTSHWCWVIINFLCSFDWQLSVTLNLFSLRASSFNWEIGRCLLLPHNDMYKNSSGDTLCDSWIGYNGTLTS